MKNPKLIIATTILCCLVFVSIVKAQPLSVVIAGPQLIPCAHDEPTLLYAITDPMDIQVTYKWYEDGILVGTNATQVINNIHRPFPYHYMVEVTDSEFGDMASATHVVLVLQYPIISITADKFEIYSGETVTLTAYIAESSDKIYQWYANGEPILDANTRVIYVSPEITTVYTFSATSIGNGCTATSNVLTVTVIPIIAVDENSAIGSILTYPNPTTGTLRVRSDNLQIERVKIFDAFGKTVETENFLSFEKIDMSHLPTGIYFVRIFTEAGVIVKKIIKE
ncbi:MAG: T9SS type A sorting domain-containing protein [Bacteroidetes bacterium]|nr:T9SS type A sorting domain-containing protein [Bacteroidota bacterium]MCL2303184.1 T9SS type A sorting domain-containing protein [Lentimicrobiaceae bacterium]